MSFKLRFVQKFEQKNTQAFMELERQFHEFEQMYPEFPKGRRYFPYMGRDPQNTLIWEAEFDTLEEAIAAKQFLENDNRHEELYQKQLAYFVESYVEIYKSLI
ncbi:MAG: hypothetical protein ACOX25_09905 [Caldicoprobacterales bacterium]